MEANPVDESTASRNPHAAALEIAFAAGFSALAFALFLVLPLVGALGLPLAGVPTVRLAHRRGASAALIASALAGALVAGVAMAGGDFAGWSRGVMAAGTAALPATFAAVGRRTGNHSAAYVLLCLGLDYKRRNAIFEEGLAVLRELWTKGSVTFHGRYFDYDDVSFYSGTEMGPLSPLQKPPPIWVVSNPRLKGDAAPEVMQRRMEAACRRIVLYGDGWMTCCRAQHSEELVEQLGYLGRAVEERGGDGDSYTISYQVTMNIGDSEEEARSAFDDYISKYYPELSQAMDLSNWGPVGTPDQIAAWLREFADAGVDHFICRFGAIDQFGQVDRFAKEVLPLFSPERVR